ncbi:hypothetical protein NPIL_276941 [Nephila pilipes]|uniref:Uncharacterized protein n=1 Tax=Nephila pilipes TaxID=299642 RepID=A0A8X6MV23_NEPPI|nr:hypothetical protein NPIL_276941 [Nephila pilipes]
MPPISKVVNIQSSEFEQVFESPVLEKNLVFVPFLQSQDLAPAIEVESKDPETSRGIACRSPISARKLGSSQDGQLEAFDGISQGITLIVRDQFHLSEPRFSSRGRAHLPSAALDPGQEKNNLDAQKNRRKDPGRPQIWQITLSVDSRCFVTTAEVSFLRSAWNVIETSSRHSLSFTIRGTTGFCEIWILAQLKSASNSRKTRPRTWPEFLITLEGFLITPQC